MLTIENIIRGYKAANELSDDFVKRIDETTLRNLADDIAEWGWLITNKRQNSQNIYTALTA